MISKIRLFIKNYWMFFLIIILAGGLRLIALTKIPASLNIDEQALGYNAYSLLKTGYDEHGKFFPISLESFGDWKLIGYPLVTIPFIALLGLSDLSTRLPSSLAGIIQVILIYFLALKFFKKKRVALFTSVLLAVSPWSIYFSRMAYEVNVATMYFISGLLAYLSYREDNRKKVLFFVACLFFVATVFTYHSFVIFIPIFCFIIFFLHRKLLRKNIFIILGFLLLTISFFFIFKSVIQNSGGKLSDLTVWNDTNTFYNRGDIFRTDGSSDKILGRIFYSKPFTIVYQIGQNYIATFSPTFLFDTGGQKLVNSLGYFGNFYILDVILLVLGLISITTIECKHKDILLVWLILGILPSAITKDAPSSTRLFLLLPLFIIISGVGTDFLQNFAKRNSWTKFLVVCFCFGYFLNTLFFFDAYFLHINYQRSLFLHYGYKQAVVLSERYPNDQVVMRGPENFPYISFLFYTQYDPSLFRKEVQYYPKSYSVFNAVKGFGKYHFVDIIDYAHLMPNTIYIDDRGIRNEDFKIRLPNGQPVFKYFFKSS